MAGRPGAAGSVGAAARALRRLAQPFIVALPLIVALALPGATATAQTPAARDSAQLRIEVGSHTGAIRALDLDREQRLLVTASEDKSARIWDLASGQLLQVLRPPAGSGNEGKLYAVAITPDSAVVATGGWSADNDVWLFERGSGRLIQRITGLPDVVTQLAFSPDGTQLLIGLWGRHGVRLWGSSDNWHTATELARDLRYEAEVQGAQFDPQGQRLAVSSADGAVRLYDLQGRSLLLKARAQAGGGLRPYGLAWSPDARWLAVGFADSAAVSVLQGSDLQAAWSPDTRDIGNGTLNAVAWSGDGQSLLAAGTWRRADGRHGLRRWPQGGRGPAQDSSLSRDSVLALRGLQTGGGLYAAADATWGRVHPAGDGQPPLQVGSGLLDFRGAAGSLRVSRDGGALSFFARSSQGGTLTQAFDLRLMGWTEALPQWQAPRQSAAGLLASNWFESAAPRLNARALPLTDNEIAMSAAVSTEAAGMALGSNFYLRLYKPDGSLGWRVPVPATVWQLNFSGDGRWIVAACGDGTLRWFRSADGVEMLALLPHADRKRWVAWTPPGYYASSPAGEDLFGWQIDRGPSRAADFFAGSRLRARFLRPDLLTQIVGTAQWPQATGAVPASAMAAPSAAALERQTPPVISILSPREGSRFGEAEVLLRVAIRAPQDAPALRLKARLDGVPYELPRAQAADWQAVRASAAGPTVASAGTDGAQFIYEQRIPLSPQDHELLVFAENRNGSSAPAVLRLQWAGKAPAASAPQLAQAPRPPATAASAPKPAPAPAASLPTATNPPPAAPVFASPSGPAGVAAPPPAGQPDLRPNLYVLAIGISKYQDPAIQLGYPSKDATDFANAFRRQENRLYRKVMVRLLTDDKARRDDVLDGLEWIRREMTSRDVGVVLMAGHGVNDADGVYYFLPQDANAQNIKRTGVIFSEIRNTLASLPGKALFFIDTCHAGNVLGTARRALPTDNTAAVNELASAENGVIVFAASTGRQFAQESEQWGNGAFTLAVTEGMSGKADYTRTGRITHKMLDLYVSERVKQLTQGSQSPVTIVPQGVPDFPLAVSR